MKLSSEKLNRLINEKSVRLGLKKGQTDYQKFIIFSNYRCGSNFLMNLLKSHRNVVCYSEVFFLDRIFWASKIYGGKEENRELIKERDQDERRFLTKHIYREYNKKIKAVGFKLHYKDMHRHEMRILKDYITNNPDTKIIHLKRLNHLDRYISTIITQRSNTAVMVDEASYKNKLEAMGQLSLDPEVCGREFEWRTSEHETFGKLLEELSANVIEISYNDLTQRNKETIDDVTKFLSLSPVQLETTQKKQNKKKKPELISNYKELKHHFSNTKWAYLFDE